MAPAHSHPQPPSPTPYTNGNPPTAAPIRRNLFSTNLSRRPASSQQTQSSQGDANTVSFIPPLSPTRSPGRSPGHSPTHTRSHASSDAIIATHANGRPLLPTLPRLPAHLRLSTTSDDEAPYSHDLVDDPDGSNSPRYDHPSLTDDEEHVDRARIEKGLVEMMWRQRQRANLSPGARRRGGAEPDGEKSREEEELMGLIMENLKEKVSLLESEAWMFGERVEEG